MDISLSSRLKITSYDIFPDYKKSRKGRVKSREERLIRRWALNRHADVYEGLEADDVVAYYASKGNPIVSADKDVLNGVPGYHYDYHPQHKCFVETSKEDAERFVLMQTLSGDSTDDIPGISGVGLKTADKLLPDNATFDDVINIYKEKGRNKDTAILMRRLVGLDQWGGPYNGVKLFEW